MRQRIYRQLAELERQEAAALQARACRKDASQVEMFRKLLSSCAIEQGPGESLAETVARASGINAQELKDFLWERTQAIAPGSPGDRAN